MMKQKGHIFRKTILSLVMTGVLLASLVVPMNKAYAACCSCDNCYDCTVDEDLQGWIQNVFDINMHFATELAWHNYIWFDAEYWELYMLPVFMMVGEQLSAVGTQQMMIIATFLDAKEAMETQRSLQVLHAKAHKDYHTSVGICEFGTRVKSLASSERRGEVDSLVMSERFINRMLGNRAAASAGGSGEDMATRVAQFKRLYCDVRDNDYGGRNFCTGLATLNTLTTAQRERLNKDIDYVRTIYRPWTLSLNMGAGGGPSDDQTDVFAMASNLYGYDTFHRADSTKILNRPSENLSDLQRAYLDMRSVVTKESVAQNSFNALIAMKAEGTPGSRPFLEAYLEQLGVSTVEIDELLGDNPSYYAQMEILTKKVYQSQKFYTNLYDTPANVARKGVAIQALGLIQKFDLLKSYLRTEASLSILLEIAVSDMQAEVEDAVKAIDTSKN